MPYPNEHGARLRDPGDFDPETFRRVKGGTLFARIPVPDSVSVIWGKLKGHSLPEDNPIAQALRFPVESWTEERARKWLEENKVRYILFEPATPSEEGAEAGTADEFILCADSLRFDSQDAGAGDETIPKFEITAYTGGVMNIEGWRAPVVVDLAGLELPETIPVLARHDQDQARSAPDAVSASGATMGTA